MAAEGATSCNFLFGGGSLSSRLGNRVRQKEGLSYGVGSQYSAEGQRLVDQGKPFTSIYLTHLNHRSPEALSDSVAHLGSYLFHELTTPLGMRLDHLRHEEVGVAARAGDALAGLFGTELQPRFAARTGDAGSGTCPRRCGAR